MLNTEVIKEKINETTNERVTTFRKQDFTSKVLDRMHECLDPDRTPVVSVLLNVYEDGPIEQYEAMYSPDWHKVKAGYLQELACIKDLIDREDECPLKPQETK